MQLLTYGTVEKDFGFEYCWFILLIFYSCFDFRCEIRQRRWGVWNAWRGECSLKWSFQVRTFGNRYWEHFILSSSPLNKSYSPKKKYFYSQNDINNIMNHIIEINVTYLCSPMMTETIRCQSSEFYWRKLIIHELRT